MPKSTEGWMDTIAAILERANHPDTPEAEREACLARAATLMATHQIEEAALRARNVARGVASADRRKPTHLDMPWIDPFDEFIPVHRQVVSVLASLCKVQLMTRYDVLVVVGYPDDIEFFRMLWLSSHLTFSSKLSPKWDTAKAQHENLRAFIEAGYKWNYTWNAAVTAGQPFRRPNGDRVPEPPADNGFMKRELAKAYRATGEEKPKLTHGIANYRNSYALAFGEAMKSRVFQLIFQRERMERQAEGGAQMVLASDVDAVERYFNELFPPGSYGYGERGSLKGNHAGAASAGRAAASTVDMSGGRGGVDGHAGVKGALG